MINIPSDSEMIFCPVRRMEAQILYVSKPTTTKPGGKSAGMLGIDIARQALSWFLGEFMDSIPLIKAKLVVPEIPDRVLFSGRLKGLDITGHRMAIITAPAGFGKTTAVLLSLKKYRDNILWYRMEKEDSFLSVFYAHLIEMLFGRESESVMESVRSFGSIGKISDEYPLLNALISQDTWTLYPDCSEPLYMVFDDFHNAAVNEAIVETIRYFISNMPPHIRFIVISRIDTGIQSGKLALSGDIVTVDEQALRFTKEEVGKLTSDVFKVRAKTSDIELMHNYFEGWIAGLTMIIHTAGPSRFDIKELLSQGGDNKQSIFRYFLSEALAGSGKEMVKNLARISILPDFTCEDLKAVFKIDNASEIITWLEKSNMYIQKFNTKISRYRFHSLFRNALLSVLNELFTQVEINEMNQNAAYYYKELGDFNSAVRFLITAGKTDEAVKIASDEGMRFMNACDFDKVAPLVQEFSDEMIQNNPFLLLFRGTALINNDFEESYAYLLRSLLSFHKNRNINLQMNVIGLIISMCYMRNDLKYLKSISPLIPKLQAAVMSGYGRKTLLLCIFMKAGWSDRIKFSKFLYNIIERLNVSEPIWEYMVKLTKLGLLYREGRIEAAEEILKLVANHPTTLKSDRWRLAVLSLSHNIISQKGDMETSQRIVSELASIGEKYNSDFARNHAMRFDAYNKYQLRDIAGAIALMDTLADVFSRFANPIMVCVLKITKYLWVSETEPAEPLAQKAYMELTYLPALLPGQGFLELCQAITGALFKEAGDYTEAEKLLRKAYKTSKGKKAISNMCGAAMHLADLYYRKKAYKTEYKYLRIWGNASAAGGHIYFREMNYTTLVRVCARCIAKGIQPDHMKKMIGGYFGAVNAVHMAENSSEAAADPKDFISSCSKAAKKKLIIRVELFGSFRISIDGVQISETEWKTRKISGILKYLLANPTRTVSREVLSALFWPESESKAASTSLRAALYELRKTLTRLGLAFESEDALIVEGKNGFYISDRNIIETDTDMFTMLFRQYKSGKNSSQVAKDLLLRLTELYTGDFLKEDLYDEWVSLSREHYRSMFIEASHNLIKQYIAGGEQEKAEALLGRHMQIDPFDEQACGMLLHLYNSTGRKSQAASLRRQFEKRFEAEMSVKPDLKYN